MQVRHFGAKREMRWSQIWRKMGRMREDGRVGLRERVSEPGGDGSGLADSAPRLQGCGNCGNYGGEKGGIRG